MNLDFPMKHGQVNYTMQAGNPCIKQASISGQSSCFPQEKNFYKVAHKVVWLTYYAMEQGMRILNIKHSRIKCK